jgi:GTP-binding protein HflX
MELDLDPSDGAGASWLYRNVEVLDKSMTESGRLSMTVRVDPAKVERVRAKFETAIKANLP